MRTVQWVSSFAILSTLILTSICATASPDRITSPIVAAQTARVAAGVPMQAKPQFDQGRVDPNFELPYITLLTVPTPAQHKALNKLLTDQQDPHFVSYHKWLTPEDYADQFGLSQNDIGKLTAWLKSQGFTIVRTARARDFIVFKGTAAQVEMTFQTEIHTFKVNGETHFSNISKPAIPAALKGVVTGFRGMNNFWPRPYVQRSKPQYTFPFQSSNYIFLAPGDLATLYNVNALYNASTPINGSGQSVAVFGQTGIYLDDISNFRTNFGLSAISCSTVSGIISPPCNTSNFQYVLVNGSAFSLTTGGVLDEADIDIEYSGAIAPNAQIIYVNATDPNGGGVWDSWYYAVDNVTAQVMSLSYGLCELGEAANAFQGATGEFTFTSDEAELAQANVEGITFMNSSGDAGTATCDGAGDPSPAQYGYAVSYPASSVYVTAVGGTLIPAAVPDEYNSTYFGSTNGSSGGSALSYIPEQPWNDDQELGLECASSNPPGFCADYGITDWASAQAVLGTIAGGGGMSNCVALDSNGVCTGGFPQPAWQAGLDFNAINPSGAGLANSTLTRAVPDVSLLASPNRPGYVFCTQKFAGSTAKGSSCDSPTTGIVDMLNGCFAGTGNCSIAGGTSFASPIFAGMVALMNQDAVIHGGKKGLGNINSTLYSLAATTPNAFNSVATGAGENCTPNDKNCGTYSNGIWCGAGQPSSGLIGGTWPRTMRCPSTGNALLSFDSFNYDATTSYNLAVGLGSPNLNNLATALLTGGKTSQTVMVTTSAPTTAIPGSSFTIVASASSGLPITYISSGACTNSGATYLISLTAPTGTTCTETLTQSGNNDYSAAPTVTETTTVAAPKTPTVSFTSTASSARYGTTFSVTASSNETGPVVSIPTISSGTSSICQITGSTTSGISVTATVGMVSGEGSCDLGAQWAINTVYSAATANVKVTAEKLTPTESFTGAPASASITSTFTITAASNETTGKAAVPKITASGSCTVGSATNTGPGTYQAKVTMTKSTGTCTTKAAWAATIDYAAASLSQKTTANKGTATTTTVTSSSNPSIYGQSVSFTATVTGSSPTGTVQFAIDGTNFGTPVTLVSGSASSGSITTLAGGTHKVTASYSGDSNYGGSTGTLSQTINQAANRVTFTTPAPSSAEYGSTFTVGAKGLGTVAITYTSDGVVCTNSGATYTMIQGSGTCTVTATQAADNDYQSASASEYVTAQPARASVSVATTGASTYGQSVTFSATVTTDTGAVKGRRTTTRPRNLNGQVSWSANTGCSTSAVSGNPPQTATCNTSILGGGTDTVTATYTANNTNHTTSSGSVNQTVNPASQSITVTTPAPTTAIPGSSFTIVASASSGLPITYTSSGACTNSGATYLISLTAPTGTTCTETLTQSGNNDYSAAPTVTETTTVAAPKTPTVSFTSTASSARYGTTFSVTAASNETGAVVSIPTITSGTSSICQITGSTTNGTSVTATVGMVSGEGSCDLGAQWAINTVYSAATANVKVTAEKLTPTESFTGAPASASITSTFTITAASNETTGKAAVPKITASGSCTVGSATNTGPGTYQAKVTMTKSTGTCTTKAAWAATIDYAAASAKQTTTAE